MYKGVVVGGFIFVKEEIVFENIIIIIVGLGMVLLCMVVVVVLVDYYFIFIGCGNGLLFSIDFVKGGFYYLMFMDRVMEFKGKVIFGGFFVMLGIIECYLLIV